MSTEYNRPDRHGVCWADTISPSITSQIANVMEGLVESSKLTTGLHSWGLSHGQLFYKMLTQSYNGESNYKLPTLRYNLF
ncbi:hypothetical protein N7504_005359 [Penicillium tannophilum]|nr:hypothetical protein N7504_005359 [Penicillium tannophilum]